jgi:hypothetical protein
MPDIDIRVEDHGSIVLLNPTTEIGQQWLDDNIDPEALWWGRKLAVEPRYVEVIVQAMISDGLTVGM